MRQLEIYRKGRPIAESLTHSRKLAKTAAKIAHETKAEDVVVLDMREVVSFCDYFVICSASSDRRIVGIADRIEEELRLLGVKVSSQQGRKEANWVLMDYSDVIVHIFDQNMREFYGLEYLWQEVKRVDWRR